MNQGTVPPFHLWDRCDRIILNRKDIIMAIAGVVQKNGIEMEYCKFEEYHR